ncbi:aldo/keto reductase [Ascoidea rubescens DSM 1968]|uniref:Aldo/keto reductase n=1 Tax=Ascoidea rubescens DSM 1968 TaxID=1344418 RepID=A0A1D2VHT7_9ASCO|nr:Aldo/keto reductase [Ascoidea rubescens DSM 1968]XP_020047530.1 Aldo/keto reductase [Ascoidea rubescens DSM 1968]ODV61221.1 Aldo/keto reductase [Ascoidea rubescens DSM 1968]ODV61223.1 Aldo/keto reductase [Ascoidea rubescens DSM 1968]
MSEYEFTTVPVKRLGDSGLKISNVVVGCMGFGSKQWFDWVEDDEEKIFGILKKCYDHGIRTFDTADCYSNGRSEEILGRFIKKYNIKRDRIVILSKGFLYVNDEDMGCNFGNYHKYPQIDSINSKGLSRKHILDAAEASAKRLGTYMDVYQIHRYDPETTPREIMKALNDVVEKGYARYIGASSMKAYQFIELQFVAEQNNWHKFISMQNYNNLLYREEEREMIPFCQSHGVGIIPWSSNARGMLTRPYDPNRKTSRQESEAAIMELLFGNMKPESDIEIINRVEKLAKKKKVSMASISIAWCVAKDYSPIVGLSSERRVDDLVVGANLILSDEEVQYLEEPYQAKDFIIL